jgi:hypothetical protein
MSYFVQLINGTIVRSREPFKFDENGWSDNADVSIRLMTIDERSPYLSYYPASTFTFRRDHAVCYWIN